MGYGGGSRREGFGALVDLFPVLKAVPVAPHAEPVVALTPATIPVAVLPPAPSPVPTPAVAPANSVTPSTAVTIYQAAPAAANVVAPDQPVPGPVTVPVEASVTAVTLPPFVLIGGLLLGLAWIINRNIGRGR